MQRPSCVAPLLTTTIAITCSTIRRSQTPSTTRSFAAWRRSRRRTPSWSLPTRPPSASAPRRRAGSRPCGTASRCSRCRTSRRATRWRSSTRACASCSAASGSSTWWSRRSTAWRSSWCTRMARSPSARRAATASRARTSPPTCARSAACRSGCATTRPPPSPRRLEVRGEVVPARGGVPRAQPGARGGRASPSSPTRATPPPDRCAARSRASRPRVRWQLACHGVGALDGAAIRTHHELLQAFADWGLRPPPRHRLPRALDAVVEQRSPTSRRSATTCPTRSTGWSSR